VSVRNFKDIIDADLAGQTKISTWRKAPTQTTAANIWFDLSMSPGNPNPNYYAASPNISKALSYSEDGGLYHGGNVSTSVKHLKRLMAMCVTPTTAVPLRLMLCDYLLYYPFVDMSDTSGISLTNSVTIPRYTTGAGVRIMAVEVAGQSGVGNPRFNLTYTNSSGTAGRTTPNIACNTQTSVGTLITTAANTNVCAGPFLPLQAGDTGVRSIETVTFLTGDVGLIAFVLVNPLADLTLYDITAASERDYATDGYSMPIIKDDAYLNFICCPSGTLSAAAIHGTIETVYN